jgi:hypothetical protein
MKTKGKIETHKLRLGVAYYYDFSKSDYLLHKARFTKACDLVKFITTHTRDKTLLYVAAHNLSFDFGLTGLHTRLKTKGWTLTFPLLTPGSMILRYEKGAKTIVFLDTLNYFKTSLDDMGKSIGLYKGEVDFKTVTDKELWGYCDNDVAILGLMIKNYRQFVIDNELGKMCFTTPSQAFTAFRSRFMKHSIYIHNHKASIHLEREAYFGGRTEAFFIGTLKKKIHVLDVNSLYPYVMKVNFYPTKLVKYYSYGVTKTQLARYLKDHCVIAQCELKTDTPIYPLRFDKRLIFPVGRFYTTLTTPSLIRALQNGHIKKIHGLALYEKESIFSDYVKYFYKLRREYTEDGNKPYEAMTKLMLNSLYGKFGQRQQKIKPIDIDLDIKNGLIDVYNPAKEKIGIYICIEGDTFFMEQTKKESVNSFPAIASHVTDYARMHLWDLMCQAGRDNVYYCDTDSVFTNDEGFKNLHDTIDNTKLGYLKHEKTGKVLNINGCKDYKLDQMVKIKGISKRAEQLEDNVYKQKHFPSLKTQLKEGGREGIRVNIVTKTLSRKYHKGTVDTDGYVKPFVLNMDSPSCNTEA